MRAGTRQTQALSPSLHISGSPGKHKSVLCESVPVSSRSSFVPQFRFHVLVIPYVSLNTDNYSMPFTVKCPPAGDAGFGPWPPSPLHPCCSRKTEMAPYSLLLLSLGTEEASRACSTVRWPLGRLLAAALSRRQTPPDGRAWSGWATARSPGDSSPGTGCWRPPAEPDPNSTPSAPPEKVCWFQKRASPSSAM